MVYCMAMMLIIVIFATKLKIVLNDLVQLMENYEKCVLVHVYSIDIHNQSMCVHFYVYAKSSARYTLIWNTLLYRQSHEPNSIQHSKMNAPNVEEKKCKAILGLRASHNVRNEYSLNCRYFY